MSASKGFRKEFFLKKAVNWFPSHMYSGFKHMQAKMKSVDCVIEVHDSRIPFTGRNQMFLKSLLGNRPHILVLNKVDLVDKSYISAIKDRCLEDNYPNVIFTNCLNQNCQGLHKILPLLKNVLFNSSRQPSLELKYNLMVIGVPNVGKSSLINALRNITLHRGKATAVGALPGVTKSVLNSIKISENPPVFLIDTPGILEPNIQNNECGMKLALCSCVKDSIVGVVTIADFLLYWMNKTKNFVYVEHFGLAQPTDDILPLLIKIAADKMKLRKLKNMTNDTIEIVPDVEYAASQMVTFFRKGKFGDLGLDNDLF